MLCWDGNFDQGYFRFFRIQYHLQIFKMFSYHCVHKVKQKSTSWQSQIYSFFHPLPYFRHSVTNWFCSRQIHDSHTHMLSQFIPAWMLLQSILREEEHKKMASNAVSIKGCSYSSMIHWFVGKRVNLFSASLIIDLRRFFRQNERSQILTLLPRQRISSKTEKDKQINKHWNTHSQQQGSVWFLIKTVEKFLFKREKDVDSRLVSLALEITLTQVHNVVHRGDERRGGRCAAADTPG